MGLRKRVDYWMWKSIPDNVILLFSRSLLLGAEVSVTATALQSDCVTGEVLQAGLFAIKISLPPVILLARSRHQW